MVFCKGVCEVICLMFFKCKLKDPKSTSGPPPPLSLSFPPQLLTTAELHEKELKIFWNSSVMK